MGYVVIMPKQGLQMTEGTIEDWLVKEGESVREGDSLFEMETDKLTITIDSPATGTLLKILCGEGETAQVADPIAVIGEPGEDYQEVLKGFSFKAPEAEKPAPETAAAAPTIENAVSEAEKDPAKDDKKQDAKPTDAAVQNIADGKVFVSPRARTRASELGVDYRRISGTGPMRMVIERDVFAAKDSMDKACDTRSAEGNCTAVQATVGVTADMSSAIELREMLLVSGLEISIEDIIIRSTAKALSEYPLLNASVSGTEIIQNESINVGINITAENATGEAVIENADSMSLGAIAGKIAKITQALNENEDIPETSVSTFTISNLGSHGAERCTAVISKLEAGILAVGKVAKKPAVVNDQLVIRPLAELTLTYDHRIVDGVYAADFMSRLKTIIESQVLMLM